MVQHRCRVSLFDDNAFLHDDHPVGDLRDDAEIVGDEHDAHLLLALDVPDKVQDLRLGGDVERGCRFVCDQHVRSERQRDRDHHALALPAGKLERILMLQHLGLRQPDLRQQIHHLGRAARRVADAMGYHDLGDLPPDRHQRIEGGKRVLENDGDRAPAQFLQDTLSCLCEIMAFEVDAAAGHFHRGRQQAHDGIGGDPVAGTRLADDAQHLPGHEIERDVLDGVFPLHVGRQPDRQILRGKNDVSIRRKRRLVRLPHRQSPPKIFNSAAFAPPQPSACCRLPLGTIVDVASFGHGIPVRRPAAKISAGSTFRNRLNGTRSTMQRHFLFRSISSTLEAINRERFEIEAGFFAQGECGENTTGDGAEAETMSGEAHAQHQSFHVRRRVENRQRVGRHVDQAGPDCFDRRLDRTR